MIDNYRCCAFSEHIRAGGMTVEITTGNCDKNIALLYFPCIIGYYTDIAVGNTCALILSEYIE